MAGRQGRWHKQQLDDLKEVRWYLKLKEEALDHTLWRTCFGTAYGPVVVRWLWNECHSNIKELFCFSIMWQVKILSPNALPHHLNVIKHHCFCFLKSAIPMDLTCYCHPFLNECSGGQVGFKNWIYVLYCSLFTEKVQSVCKTFFFVWVHISSYCFAIYCRTKHVFQRKFLPWLLHQCYFVSP